MLDWLRRLLGPSKAVKQELWKLERYRYVIKSYEMWLTGMPDVIDVLRNLHAECEGRQLNCCFPPPDVGPCVIHNLRYRVKDRRERLKIPTNI